MSNCAYRSNGPFRFKPGCERLERLVCSRCLRGPFLAAWATCRRDPIVGTIRLREPGRGTAKPFQRPAGGQTGLEVHPLGRQLFAVRHPRSSVSAVLVASRAFPYIDGT